MLLCHWGLALLVRLGCLQNVYELILQEFDYYACARGGFRIAAVNQPVSPSLFKVKALTNSCIAPCAGLGKARDNP